MEGRSETRRPHKPHLQEGEEAVQGRLLQCMACGHISEFCVLVSEDGPSVICRCACGHGSFKIVDYHSECGAAAPAPAEMVVFEEIDPQGEIPQEGDEGSKEKEA